MQVEGRKNQRQRKAVTEFTKKKRNTNKDLLDVNIRYCKFDNNPPP